MARMLIDIPDENVVAVVGAGHKEGITKYINNPEEIPPLYDLLGIKKSRFSIVQILLFLIPVVFIAVFVMAFLSGINIQTSILQYVLLTSGLSFAGCILSGSKIYSAITAFVVAPLTVLHPLLAAGWFSGIVEAKSRKVGVDDLSGFKDCESLRDFWDNNLFRVLIVVVGTNIGASIGAFLTIPNVFYPLFLKIYAMFNPIIITIFNAFHPILGKIFGWG